MQTADADTSLESLFDRYFARNVPSDEEAFAAFVGGRPYRAAMSRFPVDGMPQAITERFGAGDAGLAQDLVTGEFATEIGAGYYRALPVEFGAGSGVFVVMILPTGEYREIGELQTYGVGALVAVLVLASAGAWLLVRRLLRPMEQLTDTAQRISESDLSERIEVRGGREAEHMARTFNAMLDRLQALFRGERDFVRDASHELRVPITVCMGNLDVLAAGLPPGEGTATLAMLTDELARMARIVDDLRLLADAGSPDFLVPAPIDVHHLVPDLVRRAAALGERIWVVEGSGTGLLVADRHRITEAVMNRADNAVTHTGPGEVIAVGADADDAEVRLWVRDTGVGLAPTDHARVFDRFRRGARAYRTYRGSGLGLSIVRAIAVAHGGRVELISAPGAGMTVTMVLPRRSR